MLYTFLLGCLFLGIKSIEYAGKFEHDILPGHIPENNQQAMDKVVKQFGKIVNTRLAAAFPQQGKYEDQKADLDARIKTLSEKPAESLTPAEAKQLQGDLALAELNTEYVNLKEHVRSELSLEVPYDQFDSIRKEENSAGKYARVTLDQVNHKVEELHRKACFPGQRSSPGSPHSLWKPVRFELLPDDGVPRNPRDHRAVHVSDDPAEGTSAVD